MSTRKSAPTWDSWPVPAVPASAGGAAAQQQSGQVARRAGWL